MRGSHTLARNMSPSNPKGACTVPYPGVDKVKVKVSVEVEVNIRRRLGEATPRQGVAKIRRRLERVSTR